MEIRKAKDIWPEVAKNCHGGEGILVCKSLLDGFESESFMFMHSDDIPAGVSIGYHTHEDTEEAWFLASGRAILTYDGNEFEMTGGDISLCKKGHSHGFKAVDNCVLIVVGGNKE